MMHYGGKGKGKGKQGFQGQCNHCGEWGHKAVQCQKRLTGRMANWDIGQHNVLKAKAKERTKARASSTSQQGLGQAGKQGIRQGLFQ